MQTHSAANGRRRGGAHANPCGASTWCRAARVGVAVLAVVSAGCEGAPFSVEVGTGVVEFVPLADGQPLQMVCGGKGGQHFWVAIRTTGAGGRVREVSASVSDDDGRRYCAVEIGSVDLLEEDGVGGILGMSCVVQDVAGADGRMLRLGTTVVGADGRSEREERRFVGRAPLAPCL